MERVSHEIDPSEWKEFSECFIEKNQITCEEVLESIRGMIFEKNHQSLYINTGTEVITIEYFLDFEGKYNIYITQYKWEVGTED